MGLPDAQPGGHTGEETGVSATSSREAGTGHCRGGHPSPFRGALSFQNISGYGIDNHLCALSVLAREPGEPLPAIFTDPLFPELMRFPLSTSQVLPRLPRSNPISGDHFPRHLRLLSLLWSSRQGRLRLCLQSPARPGHLRPVSLQIQPPDQSRRLLPASDHSHEPDAPTCSGPAEVAPPIEQ